MSRSRQIHNLWSFSAGPAPATGFHFSDYNNNLINNPNLTIFDKNLVKQLDRIQSVDYSVNVERLDLKQLGVRDLIDRPIINKPTIDLSFNYLIAGVRNEDRLGFIINHMDISGVPIYNQDTCFLNNFTGQNTDYRNLFVAIAPDNEDINERVSDQFTAIGQNSGTLEPKDLFVFGFGNCYFNSYSIRASVGTFPDATISYVCENMMAYSSGSGVNIPSILPKSGNLVSGVYLTIPRPESIRDVSVIRPSDIMVSINSEAPEDTFDYIYLYNTQSTGYNKIQISGDIGHETLLMYSGISNPSINYFNEIYIKNLTDNSYNLVKSSGSNTNLHLLVHSGINANINDLNVFGALTLRNISNNIYYEINTTGIFNHENVVIFPNNNINYINLQTTYPTFGINDLAIQSFDLSVNLERQNLQSIGYVLPVDRRFNFPVFADFNFSTLVSDNQSGNFIEMLNTNSSYNILVNMYNPCCGRMTGAELAIQYKLKPSKLTKIFYSYNLFNNLVANFSFSTEIDANNTQKGLFISGLLDNTSIIPDDNYIYYYLLLESGKTGFFLTEDNDLLIVNDI